MNNNEEMNNNTTGTQYEYTYNSEQSGNDMQYNPSYSSAMDTQGNDTPMSVMEWLLTILVLVIPCVGFCVYIYWAFSKSVNTNRRNYCRASLILTLIGIILYIILLVVIGVAISNMQALY
ncbi:MAG: hypothetical protein R3Y58_01225 [Eubacteriales bacterium]